ncbi:positive regulator of late transcription, partial [Salmonella enterica]|nr:positive regulator of late transcription [Salmonella enterica]
MTEQQTDMFEHDPNMCQLLAHMDSIPAADLESRWPRSLVELIDILEAE